MTLSSELEPAEELLSIARALSVHLEWLRQTGATGLPRHEASSPQSQGLVPDLALGGISRSTQAGSIDSSPDSAPAQGMLSGGTHETAEEAAPLAERRARLEALREEVRSCTRCGLSSGRTNTVFARGTGSSGLCFVGEGPGAEEDVQGYPFVGAAGQLLDRMIGAMGLLRDEVYVCNIVKCRPPDNRKPDPAEVAECMPYLAEQLDLLKPQVIVALGATAVQGLFGTSEGIMRLRGKWKLYRGRTPVMPTFHPAYLLRTPAAKRDVWADLQAVLQQMGRPVPARER